MPEHYDRKVTVRLGPERGEGIDQLVDDEYDTKSELVREGVDAVLGEHGVCEEVRR